MLAGGGGVAEESLVVSLVKSYLMFLFILVDILETRCMKLS